MLVIQRSVWLKPGSGRSLEIAGLGKPILPVTWNFRPINKIIAETYLLPLLTSRNVSTADDVAWVVIVVRHLAHTVIRVHSLSLILHCDLLSLDLRRQALCSHLLLLQGSQLCSLLRRIRCFLLCPCFGFGLSLFCLR